MFKYCMEKLVPKANLSGRTKNFVPKDPLSDGGNRDDYRTTYFHP